MSEKRRNFFLLLAAGVLYFLHLGLVEEAVTKTRAEERLRCEQTLRGLQVPTSPDERVAEALEERNKLLEQQLREMELKNFEDSIWR